MILVCNGECVWFIYGWYSSAFKRLTIECTYQLCVKNLSITSWVKVYAGRYTPWESRVWYWHKFSQVSIDKTTPKRRWIESKWHVIYARIHCLISALVESGSHRMIVVLCLWMIVQMLRYLSADLNQSRTILPASPVLSSTRATTGCLSWRPWLQRRSNGCTHSSNTTTRWVFLVFLRSQG